MDHWKMCFLLKKGTFHYHVSLPEGKMHGNFQGICPVLNIDWIVWVGVVIQFISPLWSDFCWNDPMRGVWRVILVHVVVFPNVKKTGQAITQSCYTYCCCLLCTCVLLHAHSKPKIGFSAEEAWFTMIDPNTKNSSLYQFTPLSYHLMVRPILNAQTCVDLPTLSHPKGKLAIHWAPNQDRRNISSMSTYGID